MKTNSPRVAVDRERAFAVTWRTRRHDKFVCAARGNGLSSGGRDFTRFGNVSNKSTERHVIINMYGRGRREIPGVPTGKRRVSLELCGQSR